MSRDVEVGASGVKISNFSAQPEAIEHLEIYPRTVHERTCAGKPGRERLLAILQKVRTLINRRAKARGDEGRYPLSRSEVNPHSWNGEDGGHVSDSCGIVQIQLAVGAGNELEFAEQGDFVVFVEAVAIVGTEGHALFGVGTAMGADAEGNVLLLGGGAEYER